MNSHIYCRTALGVLLSLMIPSSGFGQTLNAAGPPDVHRIQLRVKTSDRAGAGTDDAVEIRVNEYVSSWINHQGDDRERGDVHEYDLLLTDGDGGHRIARLAEIEFLEISKNGKDTWLIDSYHLTVNGQVVFQQIFETPLQLHGDHAGTHVVPGEILRHSKQWASFTSGPTEFDHRVLEARVEAVVGHYLHDVRAQWADPPFGTPNRLTITRSQCDVVHVSLAFETSNVGWNVLLPVEFDLLFSRDGQGSHVALADFKASRSARVLGASLFAFVPTGHEIHASLSSWLSHELRYVTYDDWLTARDGFPLPEHTTRDSREIVPWLIALTILGPVFLVVVASQTRCRWLSR